MFKVSIPPSAIPDSFAANTFSLKSGFTYLNLAGLIGPSGRGPIGPYRQANHSGLYS